MKDWLISYKLLSSFDGNPITSEILSSAQFPTRAEIEEKLGRGCRVLVLSVTELPPNWR